MEDKDMWSFEKLIVKAAVLIISVITLTIGSCNIHIDYRIAKAIEQGNDPVLARIAFSSDGYDERFLHIANKGK